MMTTVSQWFADHAHLPRFDAELLVAHVLDLTRAQIIAHPERTLTERKTATLHRLAHRLHANEPLAYITGKREFWGLDFAVSSAVLVPRPETELLVELALDCAPQNATALDLGTGSGAIAIALAKQRPDLQVTATDKSAAALDVARRNARVHNVCVDFIQADWFSGLTHEWQVIVSNPPYIRPDDPHLEALSAEPELALVSPPDGLHDLAQIIIAAPIHLHAGGHLLVEHGYDQAAAVRGLMCKASLSQVSSKTDLGSVERVTLGRQG